MVATARAQVVGQQEFADFYTELGLGTYEKQIQALHLPSLDPDLLGFEGGYAGGIVLLALCSCPMMILIQ